MKNKKLLYYLIPINLLVWSFAVYRILSFGSDKPTQVQAAALPAVKENIQQLPDTFSLLLNYSDPFLKKTANHKPALTSPKVQTEAGKVPAVKKAPEPSVVPVVTQPKVIYRGMIKNRKTGNAIALMQIEGAEVSLPAGEMYQQIKILQIHADSVKLQWNKQIWFAKK